MIEVRNLVKRYGSAIAVNDISFDVNAGEVVGFLGPNGAGKTTTMKILTCFISATSGSAKIGGYDCFRQPLEVRRLVGYLPEATPLYEEMNVISYLNFIAEAQGISGKYKRDRIDEMIEVCGLTRMIHKDNGELSKGYRQRVGLAQALIHDPKILILDEPTTGLDPNQIIEIRELIKQLGKDRVVLLSTHILPEVEITCSRILIISQGKLVGAGTLDELRHKIADEELYEIRLQADRSQVDSVLGTQDWITSYMHIGSEHNGVHRYRVHIEKPEPGTDYGEKIFDLAVQNSWKFNELRRTGATLEDVFKHLTMHEMALN